MVMFKRGFSLMEMMIVLLIMAIVSAATAPMLNKKNVDKSSGVSPWALSEVGSISFNSNNNSAQSVIIGDVKIKSHNKLRPRLLVKSNGIPQITLGDGTNPVAYLWADQGLVFSSKKDANNNNQITIEKPLLNSVTIGFNSDNKAGTVAVGANIKLTKTGEDDLKDIVAIGSGVEVSASDVVAIGKQAKVSAEKTTLIGAGTTASSKEATAIGYNASVGEMSTAIGANTVASSSLAIAIGASTSTTDTTKALGEASTAIGKSAQATDEKGVAIGYNAKASKEGTAIGYNANASLGGNALAIGADSEASAQDSIAIATVLEAGKNPGRIAIGKNAKANSASAIAIGSFENANSGATANGKNSLAIGYQTYTNGDNTVAIGGMAQSGNSQMLSSNAVAIGAGAAALGVNTDAIGTYATSKGGIAIGVGSESEKAGSVAIGPSAIGYGTNAYAIGNQAQTTATLAVSIGAQAKAKTSAIAIGTRAGYNQTDGVLGYALGAGTSANTRAVAIGATASATGSESTALGNGANASHLCSTAIGYHAKTTADNQIVLGGAGQTVTVAEGAKWDFNKFIKGMYFNDENGNSRISSLINDSELYINGGTHKFQNITVMGTTYFLGEDTYFKGQKLIPDPTLTYNSDIYQYCVTYSDKRLKNVGEVFRGGLEEVKKLEPFHFVFKDDKTKTAHVGVMAQDLQKIFPNAVHEGDDGFLRIRLEDMFFAVVNAVKELDAKVDALVAEFGRIKALDNEVASLKTLSLQAKNDVADLDKQFEEIQKELEELGL